MNKKLQKIKLLLAGVSLFFLASCSEDDIYTTTVNGSTENMVYFNMQQPYGKVNTVSTSSTVTPVSILTAPKSVRFVLHCTQPAAENISVTLSQDNDAAIEGWENVPNTLNLLNKTQFTIPKGMVRSTDTVEISISDADLMALKAGDFVFPFKISAVSGGVISSNMSKGTYSWIASYTNMAASQASGAVINPKPTGVDAWTVVATRADGGSLSLTNPTYMFDENTGTSQYAATGNVSTAGILPFTMDFDLKQAYTGIKGFQILTSANNYRLSGMKVYVKASESDEWVSQGPNLTISTGNSNHYVSFYESVEARYIRCEITTVQNSANGLRIVDFNIYQ